MRKPLAVHPLLFALFPILALFAQNVTEATWYDLVVTSAFSVAGAVALLLVARLLYRDGLKAAVVVSVFLLQFFFYGTVFRLARQTMAPWLKGGHALPVWLLLFAGAGYVVKRTSWPLIRLTKALNVAGVCVVLMPLITIIASHGPRSKPRAAPEGHDEIEAIADRSSQPERLPDIYYIILDCYSRADVLREAYDFGNSAFTDYLTSQGFYVASKSRANYPKTAHSLASSLNMEHLLKFAERFDADTKVLGPVHDRLQDYKVWRFLRRKGYKYLHFGSWWQGTRWNRFADRSVNYSRLREFHIALLDTCMLKPVLSRLGIYDFRRKQAFQVLATFKSLGQVPQIEEPTYVFAHMLVPHIPYVFDRHGNYRTRAQQRDLTEDQQYLEQLRFTNKKVMELISTLLRDSPVPPIIVLQSDEGAQSLHYGDIVYRDLAKTSPHDLRKEMCILNAYYLPGFPKEKLYPTITPVNTFRLIFNHYFGTSFPLLPDESYPANSCVCAALSQRC